METTSPVVLGTVVGWGSPSSSPASVSSPGKNGETRVKPQSPIATADTNAVAAQLRSPSTPMRMLQKENGGAHSPSISNSGVSQGSPKGSSMSPKVQPQPAARAWALPSAVVPSNGKSSDFPTAAETLDHLKGMKFGRICLFEPLELENTRSIMLMLYTLFIVDDKKQQVYLIIAWLVTVLLCL